MGKLAKIVEIVVLLLWTIALLVVGDWSAIFLAICTAIVFAESHQLFVDASGPKEFPGGHKWCVTGGYIVWIPIMPQYPRYH